MRGLVWLPEASSETETTQQRGRVQEKLLIRGSQEAERAGRRQGRRHVLLGHMPGDPPPPASCRPTSCSTPTQSLPNCLCVCEALGVTLSLKHSIPAVAPKELVCISLQNILSPEDRNKVRHAKCCGLYDYIKMCAWNCNLPVRKYLRKKD